MMRFALLAAVLSLALTTFANATIVGPDAFGYTGSDEVPFVWEDISSTGTFLGNGDDDHFFFTPGFNFEFYGQSYSQFAAGTNGVLYFEDNYLGLGNTPIPAANTYGVNTFMAVFWDDLVVDGGIYWEVRGSGQDERLIVQWADTRLYAGSGYDQFQVIMYAGDDSIDFNYLDADNIDPDGLYSVGIQNDPSLGLQWSYNTAGAVASGKTIHWAVPAPGVLALLGLAGLAGSRRRR